MAGQWRPDGYLNGPHIPSAYAGAAISTARPTICAAATAKSALNIRSRPLGRTGRSSFCHPGRIRCTREIRAQPLRISGTNELVRQRRGGGIDAEQPIVKQPRMNVDMEVRNFLVGRLTD